MRDKNRNLWNFKYYLEEKEGDNENLNRNFTQNGEFIGSQNGKSFIGDFNNDGRIDLGFMSHSGVVTLALKSSNEFSFPIIKEFYTNFASPEHTPFSGDFNNDGLTDIGFWNKNAGLWRVKFKKEDLDYSYPEEEHFLWERYINYDPIVGDFNADGYTDICLRDSRPFGGLWYVRYKEECKFEFANEVPIHSFNGVKGPNYQPFAGYFDSDDAHLDIGLRERSSGKVFLLKGKSTTVFDDLVQFRSPKDIGSNDPKQNVQYEFHASGYTCLNSILPCDDNVITEEPVDPHPYCGCDVFFMVDNSGSVDASEWSAMECSILNQIEELDSICGDCNIRFASGTFASGSTIDPYLPIIDNSFQCDTLSTIGTDNPSSDTGTNLAEGFASLLTWLDHNILDSLSGEEYDPECLQLILHTDARCQNLEETSIYNEETLSLFDLIDTLEINYGATISIVHYPNYVTSQDGTSHPTNSWLDPKSYGKCDIHIQDDLLNDIGGSFVESEFDCEGADVPILNDEKTYRHSDNLAENVVQTTNREKTSSSIKVKVYPNPFTHKLNLNFENETSFHLKVYNSIGTEIFEQQYLNIMETIIDLSDYETGVYFIEIYDSGNVQSEVRKLIKLD